MWEVGLCKVWGNDHFLIKERITRVSLYRLPQNFCRPLMVHPSLSTPRGWRKLPYQRKCLPIWWTTFISWCCQRKKNCEKLFTCQIEPRISLLPQRISGQIWKKNLKQPRLITTYLYMIFAEESKVSCCNISPEESLHWFIEVSPSTVWFLSSLW